MPCEPPAALPLWIHALDPEALPGGVDLRALLDEAEQARLERFRPPEVKQQYLAAHGLLRLALTARTGVPPADWRFGAGAHGKPHIKLPALSEPPAFSLSHTRGLVACAVAPRGSLGIDVERLDRRAGIAELLPRVCSEEERRRLPQGGEALQHAFFRTWTLKEALLKAVGTGLQVNPATVGVDLERPAFLHLPAEAGDPSEWHCGFLELSPAHACAWALRTPGAVELHPEQGLPAYRD